MTMTIFKVLSSTAERVGIRDSTIVRKAEGYLRILQTKPSSKSVNDTAKMVMCLDLAASDETSFDKAAALKLTGLRKTVYQNTLNNIEKILDLDKVISVAELCVQLGCLSVKNKAEAILKAYADSDVKIKDINHPQYAVAAVQTACKLSNIKLEKPKLLSSSRLKATQWAKLEKEFSELAISLGLDESRKMRVKKSSNDDADDETELKKRKKQQDELLEEEDEEEEEDYETWSARIKREALAAIAAMENNDSTS